MNETADGASVAHAWTARLIAPGGADVEALPWCGSDTIPALAALAAEALARNRSLLLITAGDETLADISNALDLNLRPLCLVLPAADHVSAIALRATLSLLKSRLARAGSDAEGPVWLDQRRRLAEHDALWWKCLGWSNRNLDSEPWPEGLEALFPVRILPLALARRLTVDSDWVVLVEPQGLSAGMHRAWPGAQRTLLLGASAAETFLSAPDPAAGLRAELEVLTQELSELELELATAQAEIGEFTRRYHALIGTRMSTLDDLRAELAARLASEDETDIEAGQAAETARTRADQTQRESSRLEELARETARPFAPTSDVKKLFRKLAQKIHPDRARSEPDRAWRTQLMSEANRAYQAGDESALLEVLALWQEGNRQQPLQEDDRDLLASQLARLKRRIAAIEGELNRLFGSRLYELFTATHIARRTRRDLLQEMADRLDADIAMARTNLA
jgi:hypothetical protein